MGSLKELLLGEVQDTLQAQWEFRQGRDVPDAETVALGNKGVTIDAAVLYADLADSTELVDSYPPWFAAEIYKTYLRCCARLIKDEGGSVTAYDGDRVMGVFVGPEKEVAATRTAFRINSAVYEVLRPLISTAYPQVGFVLSSKVGVDASSLMVAKTGVRGANDLVWVGRAANYAAKLAAMKSHSIYVTAEVLLALPDVFFHTADQRPVRVWEAIEWSEMNLTVFATDMKWTVL